VSRQHLIPVGAVAFERALLFVSAGVSPEHYHPFVFHVEALVIVPLQTVGRNAESVPGKDTGGLYGGITAVRIRNKIFFKNKFLALKNQRIFAAGLYIGNHIKILKTIVKHQFQAVFDHLPLNINGGSIASRSARLAALQRIGR